MELLSPGGDFDKVKTAYEYGADAVYMGLPAFSMRSRAGNLAWDDFSRVASVKNGKKLYAAVNILFHPYDIAELKAHLSDMEKWPFDAFIVSDLGAASVLGEAFPDIPLHLSTQASCLNQESAKVYSKLGFKRLILAREASFDDIKLIRDAVPETEIEVFVHGAMCMAYSGRCLLSANMADRSANRGDCAHSCRWNYRLALEEEERPGVYMPIVEDNGFTTILSSKDLCMIDHIDALKAAGVSSLKIEGRMKSLYYIATVTRAYRKMLDNDPDKKLYRDEIFNVSHRSFSTGFFFGKERDIDQCAPSGYIRDYSFLGIVGEKVAPSVYALDIRNQIKSGSNIEFIGPDIISLPDNSIQMLDSQLKPVDSLSRCQNGFIRTAAPVKPGYLIRISSDS